MKQLLKKILRKIGRVMLSDTHEKIDALQNDFTNILFLNKDKINYDMFITKYFENIGYVNISYSFFDTSYKDINTFNEALEVNAKDLPLPYNFRHIDFKEGDIAIDIGGNIGLTSICLARMYPFLKIYTLEPAAGNFKYLKKNLELNNITNVIPLQYAISHTGKDLKFAFDEAKTVGSGISNGKWHSKTKVNIAWRKTSMETVKSITLDELFKRYNITKCKLLKMDCEGAEYNVLYNTKVLPNVEYFTGETHRKGEETVNLIKYIKKYIPKEKLALTVFHSKKHNYYYNEVVDEDNMF